MSSVAARPPLWPALLVAGVAILLFLPSLGHGFVYDDHRFVAENDALSDPAVLWRAFADPAAQTADGTHAGLWRPLRTLSFALDRALLGGGAWGGHLVNVLLHGVASGLLARVLQHVGAGAVAAALGALVYAAHPVQVECVSWISSRGDLLAAAFVWGALVAQLRDRAALAWLLGGAALLSKEQAVVWPGLVALADLARGSRPAAALRRAAVPALLAVLFVVLRHALLTEPFQEGGLTGGSVGVAAAGRMLAHQAWTLLLPVGGLFDWQMGEAAGGGARVVLGAVALAALALPLWRRTRIVGLWFLVALVPTLFVQVLVPLNIRVADRFLLFALPALALGVARVASRRAAVLPAAGLAAACLAALTLHAQPAWASDAALWGRTVERDPDHWRGRVWLGVTSLRAGDVGAAVEHLEHAAELAPDDAKTRFRLAEALEARAARTPGDGVVEATHAAREAYAAAINRYARGRQENREVLEPIARLRALDLTLALGDVEGTAAVLTAWLDQGRPEIPPSGAPLWNRDLARLTRHVEDHLDPQLERPLAPYLREWLIRP